MEVGYLQQALAQIIVQLLFAGMNVLCQVSLDMGMSVFSFVAYKQVVAAIVLAPFAYQIERTKRPPLTWVILFKIFMLTLFGIAGQQILYMLGFSYTGSTFASAMINLLPGFTFLISVIVRLEIIDIKSVALILKMLGTISSIGGAMVLTFYKGSTLKLLTTMQSGKILLGSFLVVISIIMLASWLVFQTYVIKDYPALLTLTTIQCVFAIFQAVLLAIACEGINLSTWRLGWNIELLTYIYSGVLGTAAIYLLQNWGIQHSGSVFVAVFNPVNVVVTTILECIFFSYALHLGSVIGTIIIVVGLYLVLLGQAKSQKKTDSNIVGTTEPLLQDV